MKDVYNKNENAEMVEWYRFRDSMRNECIHVMLEVASVEDN